MLVSVISPTWQRHELLLRRCIPSVKEQTIEVEHVVISDGPDDMLRGLLDGTGIVYAEVPEHHTEGINVGGWARNVGLDIATGDLIAYLDDDNAYRCCHIEVLLQLMDEHPADFVFSQMYRHGIGDIVGLVPPQYGCIDTSIIMHRRDAPARFGRWPEPSVYAIDWQLIESWMQQGATWSHVPEVTVDFYAPGF